MFVEMVKKSKGDLQDRAATAEPTTKSAGSSAREREEENSSTAAIHIDPAKGVAIASTIATVAALGNLSIDGLLPLQAQNQLSKTEANSFSRVNNTSIVDLTLDDGSDSSSGGVSIRPPQPLIKQEFRVKTENTWLASATAVRQNQVLDVDELMEKVMGDDEDPILRSMIGEYNVLSAKIFEIDQEVDRIKKKIRELSGIKPIDMQEMQKALSMKQKLRKGKVKAEKSRDGVVANVVAYLKSDPDEMKAFLGTCTADVPTAQTAIHRKCAALESSILFKLEDIQKNKRNMEELMSLKKDAFAEVTRLGAEIAEGEEEVRKLDGERRDEFLILCQFSKSIQAAVWELASDV